MRIKTSARSGFTIIELLIVISIIAVLAAILFPIFAKAKQSGLKATTISNMRQIGQAMVMYDGQNDEMMVPATNFGLGDDDPHKMWQDVLQTMGKSKEIFVAPGTDGSKFAEVWADRGLQSIGYTSVTAVDTQNGCTDDQTSTNNCVSFQTATSLSKDEDQSKTALVAITAYGPTANNYLGYEFNPYNGPENTSKPWLGPPLASDNDLVAKLGGTLTANQLMPVYCPYMRTGHDDGITPIQFADTHVQEYSANQINAADATLVWRFRTKQSN